jgi:hypothetical protein
LVTATAAATTKAATAATGATLRGTINTDSAAIEPGEDVSQDRTSQLKYCSLLHIVHGLDGTVSAGVVSVSDEAETTGATGIAVLNHNLRTVRYDR